MRWFLVANTIAALLIWWLSLYEISAQLVGWPEPMPWWEWTLVGLGLWICLIWLLLLVWVRLPRVNGHRRWGPTIHGTGRLAGTRTIAAAVTAAAAPRPIE